MKKFIAYHGTGCMPTTPFNIPLFVTTEMDGAQWYSTNRGDNGIILKGTVIISNPLEGYDTMLEIATSAGIKWSENPYFECDQISLHSPYDGTNSSDLVYIRAFREEVIKRGFDCLHISDILENTEIDTYVLFHTKQFQNVKKILTNKPKF